MSDRDDCKGIAVTGHSAQESVRGTPGRETASPILEAVPRAWWLPALERGVPRWDVCPGAVSHESALWSLDPDYGAVKIARDLTMATLREWGMVRMAGDVELVVSELVTNALRHAGARANGMAGCENVIQLSAMRRGAELICAVRDGNDSLPARRDPDFMAETGRGLHLVSCFSRSWGAVPTIAGGKFVWALFT
ncbi:ATP-binding protein [Actinorugispora endophytica]|uniref:ATP-binding protein n=1 Tax=Actinorugispora endophytica TaxID=1605990 RepID=UPI001FB57984|nr:ATP-binding protein [Actinorugispora endophytica]